MTPGRCAAALTIRSENHFGDFCMLGVLVRVRASTTASTTARACATIARAPSAAESEDVAKVIPS